MQIKTTWLYCLSPVRMTIIHTCWRERNLYYSLLVSIQINIAFVDISVEISQKIKNRTTTVMTPDIASFL